MKFNFFTYFILISVAGCSASTSNAPSRPSSESEEAIKNEAVVYFLKATLDEYRNYRFEELAAEVGVGDYYQTVWEVDNGANVSYMISIEMEWMTDAKDSIVVTATNYGPSSTNSEILTDIQSESITIKK